MSVLIKGMKMPESCPECPFTDYEMHCPLTDKTYNWGLTERASDCPLVEVPTHGRLIDADAINPEDKIWEKKCIPQRIVYHGWIVAGEMPTIIEAEGTE